MTDFVEAEHPSVVRVVGTGDIRCIHVLAEDRRARNPRLDDRHANAERRHLVGQFLALVVGVPLATAEGGVERSAGIGLVGLAVAGILAAFWPSTTAAVADS